MPPLTIQWTFPESRSSQFPLLLELARQGQCEERRTPVGKKETVLYTVTFTLGKDPQSVIPILQFAALIGMERRSSATIDGRPARTQWIRQTLECYERSLHCEDPIGYCWVPYKLRDPGDEAQREREWAAQLMRVATIATQMRDGSPEDDEDFDEEEPDVPPTPAPLWFFPCRQAAGQALIHPLTRRHPASLRSQVEAVLVERGCQWCPALRMNQWEEQYG